MCCGRAFAHLDASHQWMKCILCLRAHYLDNNAHISSHLQRFITALWALSVYLWISVPLRHSPAERRIMGLLSLVSFGEIVNTFFHHEEAVFGPSSCVHTVSACRCVCVRPSSGWGGSFSLSWLPAVLRESAANEEPLPTAARHLSFAAEMTLALSHPGQLRLLYFISIIPHPDKLLAEAQKSRDARNNLNLEAGIS